MRMNEWMDVVSVSVFYECLLFSFLTFFFPNYDFFFPFIVDFWFKSKKVFSEKKKLLIH